MIESIENHHLVTDHFGYWPDFHDAEIISVCCNRNIDTYSPSIEIRIYVFEMTNKLVGRYYKLIKHCIIEIELNGVEEMELDGFNFQNAAFKIEFGKEGEFLTMEIDPAYGLAAYITARQIRIKKLEVVEGDPKKEKK